MKDECVGELNGNKTSKTIQHINETIYNSKNTENSMQKPDKNSDSSKRQKTVCYDFKKGFCRRRFCRYPHVMSVDQVVFCHDFQNTGCFRSNCRFIHRTVEDEEHYRQYGVLPLPSERPLPINVNNSVSTSDQQLSPSNFYQNLPPPTQPVSNGRRRSYGMVENISADCNIPTKRMHLDETAPIYNSQNNETQQRRLAYEQTSGVAASSGMISNLAVSGSASIVSIPPVSAPTVTSVVIGEDVINIYRLYEEHNLLRRRVEINEERLQELRATNTYLLHQNEQLRRQTQCSCTSTIVNPVTLTTASQQSAAPVTQQVLNAVSIAPVQMQATPIVSIASIAQPQTQIIASSTPIAIGTANTSQGQQLALASTQQAAQQIQLGTSQITLATAPSMGITMNTSQPLAMSANATQPIISYPVMTHSILPH